MSICDQHSNFSFSDHDILPHRNANSTTNSYRNSYSDSYYPCFQC